MERRCGWAGGLVPLLLLAACSQPLTLAHELHPATPLSPEGSAATTTWIPAHQPAPTLTPPVLPPVVLPTVTPQPTLAPPLALPTTVPQPTPVPTPLPDAQAVVDAVVGMGIGEHWANYLVRGSFTTRGADERLALAGNVGDHHEVRWAVVGPSGQGWRLLGTSGCLGSGFDAPPSHHPPDVLDFDDDGRYELLSHSFEAEWGGTMSADTLYRWDGHTLAAIWEAPTVVDDTQADGQHVPRPFRADYRAEWEWADLDAVGLDEILLHERVAFYRPGREGGAGGGLTIVGREEGERAFRWDGEAFRPYAPGGPVGTFAYVGAGDVWLWQYYAARPLDVQQAREIQWSLDGRYLAWWSQPPVEGGDPGASLGIYDLATGGRYLFSLVDGPAALRWTPDGRLAYVLPDRWPILLDPKTGQQELSPTPSLGTWSPDGTSIAYERGGSLYIHDLSTDQDRPIVLAPAEGSAAALAVLPDVAWSPRGDWIACYLSSPGFTWVGLVAPDLREPVSALDLLETFGGRQAAEVRLAWSFDGSHLAALASGPEVAVLYLAEVNHGGGEPVGRPRWRDALELEALNGIIGPAWSPDGTQVAVTAGGQVWEVMAVGGARLRHQFSFPDPRWETLEWAPDGSGLLAGWEDAYHGRLYWLAAGGGEPVLLVADSLGSARWAPRIEDALEGPAERPAMVLVEYGPSQPRLHFVDGDGRDRVVRAKEANRCTTFQVGGERVYYDRRYADKKRVVSMRVSGELVGCPAPVASPDGERLAWLCDDGLPELQALIEGTAEIHFRLLITDGRGRAVHQIWSHVERGPDYRGVRLVGWRVDGAVIYLSRPRYGTAWAYFGYNPGILALDINTGQVTEVGDQDTVHDALVSPEGTWLAESRLAAWPAEGVSVTLRSLTGDMERAVPCADEALVAGDFSFSPDDTWLAWRELVAGPDGSKFLIRALRLPDGPPFTVYEDQEDAAPRIGGWLGQDDLVLVYPRREDGTGEYSSVVTLPATGPGRLFSPFVFLGVVDPP